MMIKNESKIPFQSEQGSDKDEDEWDNAGQMGDFECENKEISAHTEL